MKLMLIRQSGRPSDLEKAKKFDEEWKLVYDKAEAKAERIFKKETGRLQTTPQMIILQRMLKYAERLLTLKYGSEEIIEVPKTAKAWKTLIEKCEDTPIMVCKRQDKDALVMIIMDRLLG